MELTVVITAIVAVALVLINLVLLFFIGLSLRDPAHSDVRNVSDESVEPSV